MTGSGATQAPGIDGDLLRLLDAAQAIATKAGDQYVTVERILLAFALAKGTPGRRRAGQGRPHPAERSTPRSTNCAAGAPPTRQGSEDRYDALKKYARDLTEVAREGKLDPVIGRDEEIRRTIQVLARRTKNNPVLIGEPGRRQDRDRRGARAADRQWRRPRRPQGPQADEPRHGRAHRRHQVSRRVRGAAEGRDRRGQAIGRRHHPVHRRNAHDRRRGEGRRVDGRRQSAQAGSVARRIARHRRHHARRISQAYREGCRARTPLPAGDDRRADRARHHLDPARAEGEIRASPRGADHRCGVGRGGDAEQPLHRRPLPARQGDRPDGRGRVAAADGGRIQARGNRESRPADHPAQDRARGAEEGERHRPPRTASPRSKASSPISNNTRPN